MTADDVFRDAPDGLCRAAHLVRPDRPRSPGVELVDDNEILDHLVGLVGTAAQCPPSLWVTFLSSDDRVLPVVVPVDDLPAMPDHATVTALVDIVSEVVEHSFPRAQVIAAVVRPDGGDYGAHECRWARALWRAADGRWPLRAVAAVGEGRARLLHEARCSPARP